VSRREAAGRLDLWPLMPNRCFPPPWAAEDIGVAFVVRDHHGQALAYGGAERRRRGGILQTL
jgi:hypothetical protein